MGADPDNSAKQVSATVAWGVAGGVGVLAFILLYLLVDMGFMASLFLAVILAAVVGYFLKSGVRELPKVGSGAAAPKPPAAAAPPKPADAAPTPPSAKPTATEAAPAAPEAAPEPAPAAADPPAAPADTAPVSASPAVKPSAPLPGQAELAERKGNWKYQAEDAEDGDTSAKDYDGDGIVEGADEGAKPATLAEARGGQPDDLKKIKGVGPKLEKMLNGMGLYHFDQIAGWTDQEIAWVDANIEGFKGRVARDDWVGQAKTLAKGG